MNTRHLILGSLFIVAMSATGGCAGDPCGDYVDYICNCHENDPEYDCEAMRTTYESPDPTLQDECAVALDDQQSADAKAGVECTY